MSYNEIVTLDGLDQNLVIDLGAIDGGGKFYKLIRGAQPRLPDPSVLQLGHIGFKKDDNGAGYNKLTRIDGGLVDGWYFLSMPMHGNNVHLYNTGTEYLILEPSWPPVGLQGQHRTYVHSAHGGFYNVHHGDRGAIIRCAMDTGSGNVVLPAKTDMGWAGGTGYRNGYTIAVTLVAPTGPGQFVVAISPTDPIVGYPSGVILSTVGQMVTLDFDTANWYVLNRGS